MAEQRASLRGNSEPRLTAAQRAVLDVLIAVGEPVRASKQRSQMEPVPLVNAVAASTLAKAGLVRAQIIPWASNFVSPYKYSVTDAGREAHGA